MRIDPMVEIPLHTVPSEDGSHTSRLWQMMKKPEAVQLELLRIRFPRQVEIWKTVLLDSRANGSVSSTITPEGRYKIDVGYSDNRDAEPATYVEETLHLLQVLLNPMYLCETEDRERAKEQLQQFGLGEFPSGLESMYTSSFLLNVERIILAFAKNVGIDSLGEHFIGERELLIRLFTMDLKSPGLQMSRSTIVDLSTIVEKWGFEIFTQEDRTLLKMQEDLRLRQVSEMRAFHTAAPVSELELLCDVHHKEIKLLNAKVDAIFGKLRKMLEKLADEDIEKLFGQLGLQPLLTVENYTLAREQLSQSDQNQTRESILKYITTTDSIRLEKIHYLLRPGGYSGYKVSTEDWLNTHDDNARRIQCMEILSEYSNSSLPQLFIQMLDEEVSQLWVEGLAEHALLTHPMFWDVAEGSSLPTDPDYIRLNVEAIRSALAEGEFQPPELLIKAASLNENDFRMLPLEVATQNDTHAALLIELVNRAVRSRNNWGRETWKILETRVQRYIESGIEILIQNPTVPSLQFLIDRLVGIGHLMQAHAAANVMNSFMAEIVAKSIKMYLLKEADTLGDMYASEYTFLLTSQKPLHHSRQIGPGESIWEGLVNKIIEALNAAEEDGIVILQLIKAGNIQEVAAIVGYNFEKG